MVGCGSGGYRFPRAAVCTKHGADWVFSPLFEVWACIAIDMQVHFLSFMCLIPRAAATGLRATYLTAFLRNNTAATGASGQHMSTMWIIVKNCFLSE